VKVESQSEENIVSFITGAVECCWRCQVTDTRVLCCMAPLCLSPATLIYRPCPLWHKTRTTAQADHRLVRSLRQGKKEVKKRPCTHKWKCFVTSHTCNNPFIALTSNLSKLSGFLFILNRFIRLQTAPIVSLHQRAFRFHSLSLARQRARQAVPPLRPQSGIDRSALRPRPAVRGVTGLICSHAF
jgi:hypothetical protein